MWWVIHCSPTYGPFSTWLWIQLVHSSLHNPSSLEPAQIQSPPPIIPSQPFIFWIDIVDKPSSSIYGPVHPAIVQSMVYPIIVQSIDWLSTIVRNPSSLEPAQITSPHFPSPSQPFIFGTSANYKSTPPIIPSQPFISSQPFIFRPNPSSLEPARNFPAPFTTLHLPPNVIMRDLTPH